MMRHGKIQLGGHAGVNTVLDLIDKNRVKKKTFSRRLTLTLPHNFRSGMNVTLPAASSSLLSNINSQQTGVHGIMANGMIRSKKMTYKSDSTEQEKEKRKKRLKDELNKIFGTGKSESDVKKIQDGKSKSKNKEREKNVNTTAHSLAFRSFTSQPSISSVLHI